MGLLKKGLCKDFNKKDPLSHCPLSTSKAFSTASSSKSQNSKPDEFRVPRASTLPSSLTVFGWKTPLPRRGLGFRVEGASVLPASTMHRQETLQNGTAGTAKCGRLGIALQLVMVLELIVWKAGHPSYWASRSKSGLRHEQGLEIVVQVSGLATERDRIDI